MSLDRHVAAQVSQLLHLLRTGRAATKPQVAELTGWGRTFVNQRVALLLEAGLIGDHTLAPAGRGRAPRALSIAPDRARVISVLMGNHYTQVAVHDLTGQLLDVRDQSVGAIDGPQTVLPLLHAAIDDLIGPDGRPPVWGIGMGVPSPVEFSTGLLAASVPSSMPGWHALNLREHFADTYGVPVWVDNDANAMALGEVWQAREESLNASAVNPARAGDIVYLKVGTYIGAGLISHDGLHRGSLGSAGELAHVTVEPTSTTLCTCGKRGCIGVEAGGDAVGRKGASAARDGSSPALREVREAGRLVSAADVLAAASSGDATSIEILNTAGRHIGQVASYLVSILNPRRLVVGGALGGASEIILSRIQEAVYAECIPLATRELHIAHSQLGRRGGLHGAATMVLDELFTPERLTHWLPRGSAAGMPELTVVA